MADIYFKCQCGKRMAVDERGQGIGVPCPDCEQQNIVPVPDIAWDCEECATELSAPNSMIKESVQCVNCKAMLRVPEPDMRDMLPSLPGMIWQKILDFMTGISRSVTAPGATATGDARPDASAPAAGTACPACQTLAAPGALFCGKCGASINAAPATATDRIDTAEPSRIRVTVHRPPRRTVRSATPFWRTGTFNDILCRTAALLLIGAAVVGGWHYRDDLPGLWDEAKPRIMTFLDKAHIYRPKQTAVKIAAVSVPVAQPVSAFDSTPLFPEDSGVPAAHSDIAAPPPTSRDQERKAQLEAARNEYKKNLAFSEMKAVRAEQRLELLERIKTVRDTTAKYADVIPGDFTTLDGTAYKNVTISTVEPDGISILHSAGACKVWFRELPPEISAQYGYDPENARIYEQAANDTREMGKVLTAVTNSRQVDNAIRVLVNGMNSYQSAVNIDKADELLEKLLKMKEQRMASVN